MEIQIKTFRVKKNDKVNLDRWPTLIKPFYASKTKYHAFLAEQIKELSALQQLHYAFDRYSLLLIFQAMDAAGKDSVIKHVMSGINPQGCQVFSFKHPSATDLDHDFLWRTNQCLPERGRIGIFNRSYYEEVLIVRVHPEILQAQRLPNDALSSETIWKQRFNSIVDMGKHLNHNGTCIIKFFLHLSKEEQKKRFIERIDNVEKNWKFSAADIHERKYWKEYKHAYEECLSETSTEHSPWYVVPADDKNNARLIVSEIIVDTLKSLNMHYPQVEAERQEELLSIRAELMAED